MEASCTKGPDYHKVQPTEPKMGKHGPTALAEIEDSSPELALPPTVRTMCKPVTYSQYTLGPTWAFWTH